MQKIINFFKKHPFIAYNLRWQLSSPLLCAVMYFAPEHWNTLFIAVVGNLIGASIFFPIDKFIFKK